MKRHLLPVTCTHRYMMYKGYVGGRVDHQLGKFCTVDYMGWMDCLYRQPTSASLIGIQVTTKGNLAKHINKYAADPVVMGEIIDWISVGFVACIHAWWYKEKRDRGSALDTPRYGLTEYRGRVRWIENLNRATLEWDPVMTLYPLYPDAKLLGISPGATRNLRAGNAHKPVPVVFRPTCVP